MSGRFRAISLALIVMAASACGNPQPPQQGTPSTASADEVPFVVFVEQRLVLEGVGSVVPAPAAVGSTVSARTVSSSEPKVVEVTADGELRARSLGRATISATTNPAQRLEVEVREAPAPRPGAGSGASLLVAPPSGPLSLAPSATELLLGQVAFFEVTAGGQRFQPTWRFIGPALLQQINHLLQFVRLLKHRWPKIGLIPNFQRSMDINGVVKFRERAR